MVTLTIKRPLFLQILDGRKTLDVRAGMPHIRNLRSGDYFNFLTSGEAREVIVIAIRRYETFEAMAASEVLEQLAPTKSKEEILRGLHELYPPCKEELGVYVIEFRLSPPIRQSRRSS